MYQDPIYYSYLLWIDGHNFPTMRRSVYSELYHGIYITNELLLLSLGFNISKSMKHIGLLIHSFFCNFDYLFTSYKSCKQRFAAYSLLEMTCNCCNVAWQNMTRDIAASFYNKNAQNI